MGYQLNSLTAVTNFDISDNKLGNQIPLQLPPNVQRLNLASNGFIASLPPSISQLTSLKYLNVTHNVIEGQVTVLFYSLTALSTLDFSFNNMTGDLPQSFQSLTSMTDMYLQNNQFTGTIDVLGNLPLRNLNIGNNKFTGFIPERLRSINLQSNGNSFDSAPTPPPGSPPSDKPGSLNIGGNRGGGRKKSGSSAGLIAGIIISVLLVLAIVAFVIIMKRRNRKSSKEIEKLDNTHFAPKVKEIKSVENSSTTSTEAVLNLKHPVDHHKEENSTSPKPIVLSKKTKKAQINAKSFSVAELQIATDSFSVENFIGEGSIGSVYRAHMDDGEVLAVKKLNSSSVSIAEDFLGTVSNISMLHHPNVTELVGYCCEHGQYLLVYKFHKNGSLDEFLQLSDEPLTWNDRVKIAIGAARALEYLHEVCSPSITHKKFKSANVLLDSELNPHLTDCGLASLVHEPDQASGYVAPEVAMSGQYTIKSDVYSFGVVMLELLTGRTPIDGSRPRSEQSLVRWATPQLHDIDALTKMVDPVLDGLYPIKSVSRFADVIALCVQPEPEFRPPMSEVVQALVRLVRLAQSKRTFGRSADAEE
ncbi:hypothetical protein BUALT_Bualt02G0127400 [Buddleja alternifolia]|uniref:Protein kinase domain-containing protein n=1 Tax=Buddleja alternifolia TaxID=168488 RepID=A0AAV6Y1V0_9LAMI|nr:hypothetical protein BUALT_Bualt02G0127400 [Buddleja alternifolia]